jgi:hypothetical protein
MALQSSGTISFSQVNVELGLSATAVISLNDAAVRALFQVGSGGIALSNGYGKSRVFAANIVISGNVDRYNLYNAVVALGWNQSIMVNISVVINSGVYVYSSTTATPAFVTGTFPAGSNINIVNNGTVVGMGGAGGNANGGAGQPGGGAFLAQTSITLTNNNVIAGGGGGGGACTASSQAGYITIYYSGDGGGGGRSGLTNSAGGTPVTAGNGTAGLYGNWGTISGPGAASGGGGPGGAWGATGSAGIGYTGNGSGGAGGYCTSGSGYISWAATGSRYGGII